MPNTDLQMIPIFCSSKHWWVPPADWTVGERSHSARVTHDDSHDVPLGVNQPMAWIQREITLPALPRGFQLITNHVEENLPELRKLRVGTLHVFIKHTSASLSINENADPDVPLDLESSFSAIAPEDFPHRHTVEGPDDMPAHVKSSLLGCALTLPVSEGRLCLGTWQGIYLCEHRDRGGARRLVLTLNGE